MSGELKSLRSRAISHSLFAPLSLKEAIEQLQFVQADPIRSPARAQDLILRQRVENYRVGELEKSYPALELEEDFLYAYGFLTRHLWRLLHPRKNSELSETERKLLEIIGNSDELHPKDLEKHFGRERVVNAWGGYSKATTRTLESLHHRGFLRVARREKGIRVYQLKTASNEENLTLEERAEKLVIAVANIFAPVSEKCLHEALAHVRRSFHEEINTKAAAAKLLKTGELEKQTIDGVNYLFPPRKKQEPGEVPQRVRFLAPFDPLVWDRRRFEHFWGWAYRFEAYTPAAKRQRGYYAMPLLWKDEIIGWANARVENRELKVETGFTGKKPTDSVFRRELEREIESLKTFLILK